MTKGKPGQHDPIKTGTPTDASFHDGLFRSPQEAQQILKAVRKFLQSASGYSTEGEGAAMLGFAIEDTEVEFSKDTARLRMKTRYASGKLILIAPMQDGESEESLQAREVKIMAEFSTRLYEGHMRSTLQFYRTLDAAGKESLLKQFGGEGVGT
jgi:hypothetical protein